MQGAKDGGRNVASESRLNRKKAERLENIVRYPHSFHLAIMSRTVGQKIKQEEHLVLFDKLSCLLIENRKLSRI